MFKLAVITDEISQDFSTAAGLAVKYGLDALEARSVNERGAFEWTRGDVAEMKAILQDTNLALCCVGAPLFKCDIDNGSEVAEHIEGLQRCIEYARELGTSLIRGFTFWNTGAFEERLGEIAGKFELPVRLLEESGMTLVLEHDPSVHATNAAKLVSVVKAVDSPRVRALWDPGNDIYDPDGERPYPDGYEIIRPYMAHMHLKDAMLVNGKPTGTPVGRGAVDLEGQFARLMDDGYEGFISLETHYRPHHLLSEEVLAMPKGAAFSYGGFEATEESLILWREMLTRIKERKGSK